MKSNKEIAQKSVTPHVAHELCAINCPEQAGRQTALHALHTLTTLYVYTLYHIPHSYAQIKWLRLQPLRLPGHQSSCGNSCCFRECFIAIIGPMNEGFMASMRVQVQRSTLIHTVRVLSYFHLFRSGGFRWRVLCGSVGCLGIASHRRRCRCLLGQLQIGVWVGVGGVHIDTIWLLVKTVTVRSLFASLCRCQCRRRRRNSLLDAIIILLPVPSAECRVRIVYRVSGKVCGRPHTHREMIMILDCGSFA